MQLAHDHTISSSGDEGAVGQRVGGSEQGRLQPQGLPSPHLPRPGWRPSRHKLPSVAMMRPTMLLPAVGMNQQIAIELMSLGFYKVAKSC